MPGPLSSELWLIIGAAVAAAELVVPGVFLLWIGLAAIATAGVVRLWPMPDHGMSGQLLVFALASLVSVAAGWMLWRRRTTGPETGPSADDLGNRARFLIGRTGVVEDAIYAGSGRVHIGDGSWPATGPDLPAGAAVRITDVHGTTLVVESAAP